jgi:hypothetical protein
MKPICLSILAAALLLVTSIAEAHDQKFKAFLAGAQEVPGTDTSASGDISVRFNRSLSRVTVDLKISRLLGGFAAAHFHCNRPGANGPVAFGLVNPGPLSFDGRRIRGTLTNADFTGADCADVVGRPVNNIAALAFAMRDGLIYVNVHTSTFPGGDIRGQMLTGDDRDD